MNVLYICNDFAGSRVHANLVRELDSLGVRLTVYCPMRRPGLQDRNAFEGQNVTFHYSDARRPWHRVMFLLKERALWRDMRQRIDLGTVDVIHASTVFSDGVLAYRAWQQTGTPYALAVRATDVDLFGLMPHLWPLGSRVLRHSSRIYFISETMRRRFWRLPWVRLLRDEIEPRCVLRPNGLDEYWTRHVRREAPAGSGVLYVGDFQGRKNVPRLIEAVARLRRDEAFRNVGLTLVGGGRDRGARVERMVARHGDFVTYLGPVHDRSELASVMHRHAVFCMPSMSETFGLVYVEALSQGLPIVFTQNDGIDGMFLGCEPPVGLAVSPQRVGEICNALKRILSHSEQFGNGGVDFSLFDWHRIARAYLADYEAMPRISSGR